MACTGGGVNFISFLVFVLLPTQVFDAGVNSVYSGQDSVRWEVSEFGACSLACGGGVQVRSIRCIREPHWYERDLQVEVPAIHCPLPSPSILKRCNEHKCTAVWALGNWTECSETCGVGTQTRSVKCVSVLILGQRYQVAHAECGSSPPPSSRKCSMTDCPFSDEPEQHHSILSENYTLIQLRKSKKLKLNIGGKVKLLPGQSIVIKCPVKHYPRKLVYWSKGYRLVPFMGRVRSTFSGLHIRKANPNLDGGVYTCIASEQKATITVEFIRADDPEAKIYKKWIRQSKRQLQKRHLNNGQKSNNILLTPSNIATDELSQQRDQSQNASSSPSYVTGDWSDCNAICGANGHRKREVSCSYMTPKYVKIVQDSECNRVGLVKPETKQMCESTAECPMWRTGPWTKCRPGCGKVGRMIRILTCEWAKSGKPAWDACDIKKKPVASKPCKTKPCLRKCRDNSRYCSLVKLLKMCRFPSFRRKCCKTCNNKHKKHKNSTS